MEISLSLSLTGRLLSSAFSPALLFALAEPGVWYDPSDVANLNWRRNLLTFTEQFDNAAWTKTNSSITANAVSAPNGTTTADKLVENTANSTHTASQAFTTSASTSYTFTVYAKADTRSHLDLSALTGFTTNPIVRFTLSGSGASSVRQGSPTPTHSIQSVGDGWYRCQINVTTVAGGSSTFQVALAVDASSSNFYTGNGTSGLFLWGAQLELGSTITDYQRISDVNTEVVERFPTATLFQDTAGTQPVTTPGQTVALALDKSKGLVLESEQIVNGSFSADTDWTKINGATISGGVATLFNAATTPAVRQLRNFTLGRTYLVSLTWTGTISAGMGAYGSGDIRFLTNSTLGSWTGYVTLSAGTGSDFWVQAPVNSTATVDNISVRELPGFHATQATAASRPTYGIVPATGRRNLLTRTEEFNDAVWTKTLTTVTANAAVAPDGTTTAELATPNDIPNNSYVIQNSSAQTGTLSFYAKEGAARYFIIVRGSYTVGDYAVFDLQSGTITRTPTFAGSTASIVSIGSGWYRCILTSSQSTAVNAFSVSGAPTGLSTSAPGGLFIWGAQLETGSSATAYQRVGSAFDVTEAGVASLSYLSFDGVDDFLVTPTITPGVDKAQVFAGVRKLSDAARAIIAELSTTAGNAGTFVLEAPSTASGNDYRFGSGGSLPFSSTARATGYTSPLTNVVVGFGDISADSTIIRVNGTQQSSGIPDQGTGNFLAYPLYIGRRGGTTLPFNGQLYSMIVRFGANLDANTITNTETWVNGKTGAY